MSEKREKVQLIKQLPFSYEEKATYILTLYGEKPSSSLLKCYSNKIDRDSKAYYCLSDQTLDRSEGEKVINQINQEIVEKAEEIGTLYFVRHYFCDIKDIDGIFEPLAAGTELLVSQDEGILDQLKSTCDPKKRGELFGYPEPAIDNFLNTERAGEENISKIKQMEGSKLSKEICFLPFVPSTPVFEELSIEEKEIATRYHDLIREADKEIYQGVIEEWKRRKNISDLSCL